MRWVNDIITLLAMIVCLTVAFLLLVIVSAANGAQLDRQSTVECSGGAMNTFKL